VEFFELARAHHQSVLDNLTLSVGGCGVLPEPVYEPALHVVLHLSLSGTQYRITPSTAEAGELPYTTSKKDGLNSKKPQLTPNILPNSGNADAGVVLNK
jgi:hypothetical protein